MNLDWSRSQMISVSLHVAVLLTLMLLPSLTMAPLPLPDLPEATPLVPRKLLWRDQVAGGGAQESTQATAGRMEVAVARRMLVPPTTKPLDHTPPLIAEAALAVDVPMPLVDSIGDPLALVKGPPSSGRGKGPGGPGEGEGPGVGNERGPGVNSYAERWRGVTAPVVIHRVEPEYPDEARKARFQGSVLVAVEVDEQGRVRGVRVVKPAGLGLDEKAIEAVKQWRFRPATRDGRAVAVPAQIEVSFHLL
jgi:protein TonB